MPPLVLLESVEKHYDNARVLDRVSLTLETGEFVALMGPSGCGKSTLMNLIGGMDTPSHGQIRIADQALDGLTEQALTTLRREKIGFVFQFFNLLSTLTVLENVMLPLELGQKNTNAASTQKARESAMSLLQEMNVAHRASFYPSQISGGEMQRVAIARALIHQPALLLADEPTGNLDSENGQHILALLQRLAREKHQTILMATHSLEAASYADRTLHMKDGRLC